MFHISSDVYVSQESGINGTENQEPECTTTGHNNGNRNKGHQSKDMDQHKEPISFDGASDVERHRFIHKVICSSCSTFCWTMSGEESGQEKGKRFVILREEANHQRQERVSNFYFPLVFHSVSLSFFIL